MSVRTAASMSLVYALGAGCATLGPPSAEIAGPPTLEVDALARAARRNGIAGEAILVGGGALGLGSGALMLASSLRKCGQLSPGCNGAIDTSSTALGASSLFVTAIGAVFFAIGYTQKRVVQKLRGQRHGP